jgi:pyruvate/2-oxoacid:ferredoxin oxidoreductase beta subunit
VTQVTKLEQLYGREGISPGHSACQGCGALVAVRQILQAAEPPFIVVTPTSCLEVVTSQYPYTAWRVPWVHVAFENAAAVASGIEAALRVLGEEGAWQAPQDSGNSGRRWNLRHRAASPFGRPREKAQLPIRLLRQRSLHEHRDTEVRSNTPQRGNHHHAAWKARA